MGLTVNLKIQNSPETNFQHVMGTTQISTAHMYLYMYVHTQGLHVDCMDWSCLKSEEGVVTGLQSGLNQDGCFT